MSDKNLPEINTQETALNIIRLMRQNKIDNYDLMMTLHYSSPTNIYNWKNGKYLPSADSLVKLAYIFGCEVTDILVVDYPKGANE